MDSETHVSTDASTTISTVSGEKLQRQKTRKRISNLIEDKTLTRKWKRRSDTWKININKNYVQEDKNTQALKATFEKEEI